MTAISGRRMAETMARRGGIAILPQDIPTGVVAAQIAKVKAAHPIFETPIRVVVGSTVGEAMALIPKRAHGVAVVVEDNKPVGIISPRRVRGRRPVHAGPRGHDG
jgi:IMP dehydrogenase